jgi:adenylate kinase
MADRFDVLHASTGDIFRAALSDGSELGKTVQGYLDDGLLVPDELTSRVVKERVVEQADSYILDGYPRTVGQAEHLEAMLNEQGAALDCVVYFELPDEEAVVRLTGRRVCSECGENFHVKFMPPQEDGVCDKCGGELKTRSDSSEEVVRKRLAEYHEKTRPLVAFYEERDLIRRVDATDTPDEVSDATAEVLSPYTD